MSCKEAQSLLEGYVDGELDLIRSLEIERHLEDCPACLQAVHTLKTLRSSLRGASLRYSVPATLPRNFLSAVEQAAKEEQTAKASPRFSLPFPPLTLRGWSPVVLAASVILLLIGYGVRTLSVPSAESLLAGEVVSGHVRSLMVSHLADVPSTDQHTVKPWFNGKLDFAPPVVNTTEQGFPLLGGRLDYLDNRPVAALVYGRHQHRINVFVWPSSSPDTLRNRMTYRGYHLIHWVKSGMNYWAVSDLNPEELDILAGLLQKA